MTNLATPPRPYTPSSVAIEEALHLLHPLRDDYATTPILSGFNWNECMSAVAEGRWYLVVFRSVRRETAHEATLTEFDDAAFTEALAVGGLLHYFRGDVGAGRHCLSFCLWESAEQARAAQHMPRHRAAVGLVHQMYESFALERYILFKRRRTAPVEVTAVR